MFHEAMIIFNVHEMCLWTLVFKPQIETCVKWLKTLLYLMCRDVLNGSLQHEIAEDICCISFIEMV
jgi:hypothetical protein